MNELSRTKIDKLGERLKKDEVTEEDLRLLDQFRQSFADSYQEVVGRITDELGLAPSGRLAKSTASISEKLRRESIRLTQMQDVAGCRIIVPDTLVQDEVVTSISNRFERVSVVDRRLKPSHGYRAVHIIIRSVPKFVEVQIRTTLQHLWAELSEKLADKLGQGLKYGRGDSSALEMLMSASDLVFTHEKLERYTAEKRSFLTRLQERGNLTPEAQKLIQDYQTNLVTLETEKENLRLKRLTVLQNGLDIISKIEI